MLPPTGLEPNLNSVTEIVVSTATSTTAALLSQTSSALATATNNPTNIADNSSNIASGNGECRLLGPFAIFVQGALGLLALTALVFKRCRERPQRPMKIWFFDVSKQIVGSMLVHVANLAMSMLSSGQFSIKVDPKVVGTIVKRLSDPNEDYSPNPCSFYLLNLAIDTTIGIPILIFLLHLFTLLFLRTSFGQPPESIESGNYGSPANSRWWLKQSLIYFIGLLGMKICVLTVFIILPWISRVGDWALRWTEGNEVLQVIFVMLVFPLIMNATQYYIIDSFIKNKSSTQHELLPGSEPDENLHPCENNIEINFSDNEEDHLKEEQKPVTLKRK
ncbi:unnamed protein product [Blumeria hordei]|uniref:Vacuolar membrane protein n=2 Tax=Blumeria hordei TaxID=2867405 RepID=A0A383UTD5_BLUHO|nr:unnamed protein product [Blumeria hordei]